MKVVLLGALLLGALLVPLAPAAAESPVEVVRSGCPYGGPPSFDVYATVGDQRHLLLQTPCLGP